MGDDINKEFVDNFYSDCLDAIQRNDYDALNDILKEHQKQYKRVCKEYEEEVKQLAEDNDKVMRLIILTKYLQTFDIFDNINLFDIENNVMPKNKRKKCISIEETLETSYGISDEYNILDTNGYILHFNVKHEDLPSVIYDNNYMVVSGEKYI